MSSTIQLLSPPAVALAALLLSRRWPRQTRLASSWLAAVNGLALLGLVITGWLHRVGALAEVHRWLPHGLILLNWTAIPFAIGVSLALLPHQPFGTAARVLGLLALGGILFLASVAGYAGPSRGQGDEMTLQRFRVLHEWVCPMVAMALVVPQPNRSKPTNRRQSSRSN